MTTTTNEEKSTQTRERCRLLALIEDHSFIIGFAIRLILMFALPPLMDDGLLIQGVRYTDIDYDVFTDAAEHVAHGRSPYARHTYRYTPFLAKLLALPLEHGIQGTLFSTRYFGKMLFCIADAICGYIIVVLRRRQRVSSSGTQQKSQTNRGGWKKLLNFSPELIDALWWLYNPLPINICTRGSAESLVVLLPVLATVAITDMYEIRPSKGWGIGGTLPIIIRASVAGVIHGIGIHAKLYPIIYTASFMAAFSRQQQQRTMLNEKDNARTKKAKRLGWMHVLSDQMQILGGCFCCGPSKSIEQPTFPWRHPLQILTLAILWVQRLFLTMSSILFLLFTVGTVWALTYAAVHFHGREALDEGLLYHFQRVDHRHNYSMYWYWIYLGRGRVNEALSQLVKSASSPIGVWGHVPLIPQIVMLGFASLGIAPYDLTLALFSQTFAFVAFNKVMTAQYFTWYLCLLPLCSDRIQWSSKRMILSLGLLLLSIITWLASAFSLEMLGWKSHRQVWLASLFFFMANMNLMGAILSGYKSNKIISTLSNPGEGWAAKSKMS